MIQSDVTALVSGFGDLGVFLAMFLESSIVPIPSEAIIIGAGAIGIPIASVFVFGALGATCGAAVGYCLGRYAAMPVILKFGRFILIKPHHIEKAEKFAKKYGAYSVLIGRLLPIIPFKVFSIAAGITRINFVSFMICTLIGVLPRIYILVLFGASIVKYKTPALILIAVGLIIFIVFKLIKSRRILKNENIADN